MVGPGVAPGIYRLKVTLSDDNELDPKFKQYLIKVVLKDKAVENADGEVPDIVKGKLNYLDDKKEE